MRRQAQRIAVAIPVELDHGKGVTRDVSACGVYFETDMTFSPGAAIRLCLILEHVKPVICLHCQGRIVRVEKQAATIGVAVAIDSHRIGFNKESGAVD